MTQRSWVRSITRFVTLLPAVFKDTWNEARGRNCSWSCGEGHTYDKWCIMYGTSIRKGVSNED